MSAPYGTRRNSAIQVSAPVDHFLHAIRACRRADGRCRRHAPLAQASPLSATAPLPIASTSPYSPGQAHLQLGASLSSSVGKHKRPSTINKTRRLSTSHQLRPPGLLSQSVPVTDLDEHAHHHVLHHAADGQLPRKSRKEKGQTYECEKCSKVRACSLARGPAQSDNALLTRACLLVQVYRHSTCLTKHRWVSRQSHPDISPPQRVPPCPDFFSLLRVLQEHTEVHAPSHSSSRDLPAVWATV